MGDHAEQFFLNIRGVIIDELRTLTEEERNEILEELEESFDDTVLTFDLDDIMEDV
jgi:Lhr-like helicase